MSKWLASSLIIVALATGVVVGVGIPRQTAVADEPDKLSVYERGQLMTNCYAIQEAVFGILTFEEHPNIQQWVNTSIRDHGIDIGARPGSRDACLDAVAKLP